MCITLGIVLLARQPPTSVSASDPANRESDGSTSTEGATHSGGHDREISGSRTTTPTRQEEEAPHGSVDLDLEEEVDEIVFTARVVDDSESPIENAAVDFRSGEVVTTNTEGIATIRGSPQKIQRPFWVRVEARGFLPLYQELPAETQNREFRLTPGIPFHGRVRRRALC